MTKIVDLKAYRAPVKYTVHLTNHWDGSVEVFVDDVADDERSRTAVANTLERAAIAYNKSHPADAMHAIMLANIDMAMATTDDAPVVFTVKPAELSMWAAAVEEWERARFPFPALEGEKSDD